jgi:predicted Zn-dependent peptidase
LLVSGDASGAIAEPAADVLLEVLAGGAESSFAQALRREGVAVHTLRLGVKRWPEAARYRVLVRCPPEDTVRVRRVLADEIARVRVDGVSAAELSRAKGSAFHDLAAEWSTTEGVFDAIARLRVRSSPPNDVVRTAQERAALTPEGVNDVVPALLAPERLSWVEVSPVKNSGATP